MKFAILILVIGLLVFTVGSIQDISEFNSGENSCELVKSRVYPSDFIGPLRPCDSYEVINVGGGEVAVGSSISGGTLVTDGHGGVRESPMSPYSGSADSSLPKEKKLIMSKEGDKIGNGIR